MYNKLLLLFTALLTFTCTYSQQEKEFVEVTVADTAVLAADEIIFCLLLQEEADISSYEFQSPIQKKKALEAAASFPKYSDNLKKMYKIIAEQKVDTLPVFQYGLSDDLYGVQVKKKMLFRFSNSLQLNDFIKSISSFQKAEGFIVSKKSSEEERYIRLLNKKLLEKAFAEVNYLAQQSQKKIVKLLQVKNGQTGGNDWAGWTSYPPLSALRGGSDFPYNNEKIVIGRTLTVTYSWQYNV